MPASKKTVAPLHTRLLNGLTVKSRDDGSVHTVKADGKTVAEVCVGKKFTRVNFKHEAPASLRKKLSGKSKSWPGGGVIVTAENVAECRSMIESAVQRAQAATGAADVAADLAKRKTATASARTRVAAAGRAKVTAS